MRILILLSFVVTHSLFGQETLPAELFQQQIEASCKADLQIQKAVTDLNLDSVEPEIKSMSTEPEDACTLPDEVVHAFLIYHGANRIRDYYDISQVGDTIIATLLPGKKSGSSLLKQKITLSPDGKTLRYVESEILREYWLFTSYAHIQVAFDEKGIYQTHQLETQTEVAIIGDGVHVKIEGKRE